MNITLIIFTALGLDLLIGDPVFPFHPVRGIGALARIVEKLFCEKWGRKKITGLFALLTVWIIVMLIGIAGLRLVKQIHPFLHTGLSVLFIYFSFALKDLIIHGKRVLKSLQAEDLPTARCKLSMMVSRETETMDQGQIIISTLESLGENFLDSLVAPLFYTFLFGPLGALGYRVLNTLDAMWGYKNSTYRQFGFFAAKLDDLVNYLPARLSALLLILAAALPGYTFLGSLKTVLRDSRKHESPNSGYPEAAAAGALKVGLGGEVVYFGKRVKKPEIGAGEPTRRHILRLIFLLYTATCLFMLLFGTFFLLVQF